MSLGPNVAAIAASLFKASRYRTRASRLSPRAATDLSHGRKGLLPNGRWNKHYSPPELGGVPFAKQRRGGLFKDEQYRLIRKASRASIKWLRIFEQFLMCRTELIGTV